MHEKYVTFKRDELIAWYVDGAKPPLLEEIPDAVVIRLQDTFAPPALESYANSITVTIEILKLHGEVATAERLQEIADYFADKASISWQIVRKLPD